MIEKTSNGWEIRHGAWGWTGKTKQAAERLRDKHIDRLLHDDRWEPIFIPFPGGSKLAYLQPSGYWSYYNIDDDHPYNPHGSCVMLAERDRKQVEIEMRRHIAQTVFDRKTPNAGYPYLHPDDKAGRASHDTWTNWQLLMWRYRSRGLTDSSARIVADIWSQMYNYARAAGVEDGEATMRAEEDANTYMDEHNLAWLKAGMD